MFALMTCHRHLISAPRGAQSNCHLATNNCRRVRWWGCHHVYDLSIFIHLPCLSFSCVNFPSAKFIISTSLQHKTFRKPLNFIFSSSRVTLSTLYTFPTPRRPTGPLVAFIQSKQMAAVVVRSIAFNDAPAPELNRSKVPRNPVSWVVWLHRNGCALPCVSARVDIQRGKLLLERSVLFWECWEVY